MPAEVVAQAAKPASPKPRQERHGCHRQRRSLPEFTFSLFYPRGLAGAASLVEPVNSGDRLTARLGALADIFDLFLRTADGKPPKGGSLNAFRDDLVGRLQSSATQEQARAAVEQLVDINRIRNGRLHTDATNRAESLRRLGVPASDSPTQQWDRIRTVTVEAVYTIIQLRTVPGSGCGGSDVVVLVPQLVSQTARRGDRLDGEAVFEAA